MLSVDGDVDAAVEARIQIGWNKFRHWYHCLPIGICHWLGEGDCIAVVCEVVCYLRPGLSGKKMRWHFSEHRWEWSDGDKLEIRSDRVRCRENLFRWGPMWWKFAPMWSDVVISHTPVWTFRTSAELSGQFGTVSMVPKCLVTKLCPHPLGSGVLWSAVAHFGRFRSSGRPVESSSGPPLVQSWKDHDIRDILIWRDGNDII